jgi:hypothetical protein
MRNIVTSTIAALVLSASLAGAATASPISDGGDAYATKLLVNASQGNLVTGVEGAANDGQQSPLGQVVPNNVVTQAATTSELPSPNGE